MFFSLQKISRRRFCPAHHHSPGWRFSASWRLDTPSFYTSLQKNREGSQQDRSRQRISCVVAESPQFSFRWYVPIHAKPCMIGSRGTGADDPSQPQSRPITARTRSLKVPILESRLDLETTRASATTGLLEFATLGLEVGFLRAVVSMVSSLPVSCHAERSTLCLCGPKPKCLTASRAFLGPRRSRVLAPVGFSRASWSSVRA